MRPPDRALPIWVVAAATLGLSAGYRRAVRQLYIRVIARMDAGDPRLLLAMCRPDVHFTFPGSSSFAIDTHDRADLERWAKRTASIGLVHQPQDILLTGPPWAMTIAVRLTDRCTTPDGRVVYDNVAVIVSKARWGRVVSLETFLDMDRVGPLDDYLAGLS